MDESLEARVERLESRLDLMEDELKNAAKWLIAAVVIFLVGRYLFGWW